MEKSISNRRPRRTASRAIAATPAIAIAIVVIIAMLAGAAFAARTSDVTSVTYWLGSTTAGFVNDTGTAARFTNLGVGCARVGGDALFLPGGDDHTVRGAIESTGLVTTVVGEMNEFVNTNSGTGFTGSDARLNTVTDIYVWTPSFALVVEQDNHCVNHLNPTTGYYSTFYGLCGTNGTTQSTYTSARFHYPFAITPESQSSWFLTERHRVRWFCQGCSASTIAGSTTMEAGYQDSSGTTVRFDTPLGIAMDRRQYRYGVVADSENRRLRLLQSSTITTAAGDGTASSTDGTGTGAAVGTPRAVVFSPDYAHVFFTDGTNYVRRMLATAPFTVDTVIGTGAASWSTHINPLAASVNAPRGLCIAFDRLYILGEHAVAYAPLGTSTASTTASLVPTPTVNDANKRYSLRLGPVKHFLGTTASGYSLDHGLNAQYVTPSGCAIDANLTLFADEGGGNRLRSMDLEGGSQTLLVGNAVGDSGTASGDPATARLHTPTYISLMAEGVTILVAESTNGCLRKYDIPTGWLRDFVGLCGTRADTSDASGTSARFGYIEWAMEDPLGSSGDVFVADFEYHKIKKVTSAAYVTVVAGTGTPTWTDNASPLSAAFNQPQQGQRQVRTGDLFIFDSGNFYIRKIAGAVGAVSSPVGTGSTGSVDGFGNSASIAAPTSSVRHRDDDTIFFGQGNQVRAFYVPLSRLTTVMNSANTGSVFTANDDPLLAAVPSVTGLCFPPEFSRLYVFGAHGASYSDLDTRTITYSRSVTVTPALTVTATIPPTRTTTFSVTNTVSYTGTVSRTPIPAPLRYTMRLGSVTHWLGSTDGTTSGFDESAGAAGRFNMLRGCLVTRNMTLTMIDYANDRLRQVDNVLKSSTPVAIVGDGTSASADGTGTAATMASTLALAYFADGATLAFADSHCIRTVYMPTLEVATLAGSCATATFADGTTTAARFSTAYGLALDEPADELYVADQGNHRLRTVTRAGVVATFLGTGTQGTTGSLLDTPRGLTIKTDTRFVIWCDNSKYIRSANIAGSVATTRLFGTNVGGSTGGFGTSASVGTGEALAMHPDQRHMFVMDGLVFFRIADLDRVFIWNVLSNPGAGAWTSGSDTTATVGNVFGACSTPGGDRLFITGNHAAAYADFETSTGTVTLSLTASLSRGTLSISHSASIGSFTLSITAGTVSRTVTLSASRGTMSASSSTTETMSASTSESWTASQSFSRSESASESVATSSQSGSLPLSATESLIASASETLSDSASLSSSASTSDSDSVTSTITPPPTSTKSFSASWSESATTSVSPSESASSSSSPSPSTSETASESESASSSNSPSPSTSETASESASGSDSDPSPTLSDPVTATKTLPVIDPMDVFLDETGRMRVRLRRASFARLDAALGIATNPNATDLAAALQALAPTTAASKAPLIVVVRRTEGVTPLAVVARVAYGSTDPSLLTAFEAALQSAVAGGIGPSATAPGPGAAVVRVVDEWAPEAGPGAVRPMALTAFGDEFAGPRAVAMSAAVTGSPVVCSTAPVRFTVDVQRSTATTAPTLVTWTEAATSASVAFTQATGPAAIATFAGEGTFTMIATATLENVTATAAGTVRRLAPVSQRVGATTVAFSAALRTATVAARGVPSLASATWSVLQGTAIVTPTTLTTTTTSAPPGSNATAAPQLSLAMAVEGAGEVTLLLTVQDPECGQDAFVPVTLAFDPLPPCDPATTCGGHGTCKPDNACSCFASSLFGYYSGLDCSRCAEGYGGATCTVYLCQQGVSCEHGTCSADGLTCECHADAARGYWSGSRCDTCRSAGATGGSFAGATCTSCAPSYFPTDTCDVFCADSSCAGNGVCGASGACECYASAALGYWTGATCEECQSGYAGANCTQTCDDTRDCSGTGECVLDAAANVYTCTCTQSAALGFWTSLSNQTSIDDGPLCAECADGYAGVDCRAFVSADANLVAMRVAGCVASCQRGTCSATTGACECFANSTHGHWAGEWCTACAAAPALGYWSAATQCRSCASGYFGAACSGVCPGKCSGHGACVADGTCQCSSSSASGSWSGAACDVCAANFYGSNCTVACAASSCDRGTCGATGCGCFANATHGYWAGAGCDLCSPGFSRSSGCTACSADHYGATCVLCTRGETCSGHGTCGATTGACECDADATQGFWAGANCDRCAEGYLPGCVVAWPTASLAVAGARRLQQVAATSAATWLSARWRTGFVGLTLTLGSPINLTAQAAALNVSAVAAPACDALFHPPELATFGTDAACSWANATTVLVTFGNGFTFGTGAGTPTVSPVAGAVFAGSEDSPVPVAAATLSVPLPGELDAVVAAAATPSLLGPCDGITVDASATTTASPLARLSLAVTDLTATAALRSAVAAAAFDARTRIAAIPAWAVPIGTHRLRLTAEDGVTGLTGTLAFVVTKTAIAHPRVAINGPAVRDFAGSAGVSVTASAAFSTCTVATTTAAAANATTPSARAALKLGWTVTDSRGFVVVNANASATTTLQIGTNVLNPVRGPFTATVTAFDSATGGRASASVSLRPSYAAITATLRAPAGRTAAGVNVSWECRDPHGAPVAAALTCSGCSAAAAAQLAAASTAAASSNATVTGRVELAAGTWAATADVSALPIAVTWTLACATPTLVNRSIALRAATTTAVASSSLPAIALEHTATATAGAVSAGARWAAVLRVAAATLLPSTATVTWTCLDPCELDLADTQTTAPLGDNGTTFVIAEDRLEAGAYVFAATVTDAATNDTTTIRTTVTAFAPPSAGVVSSSAVRVGPSARVVVAASGYVAGAAALRPLTYALVHTDEQGRDTTLVPASPSPSLAARVPGVVAGAFALDTLTVVVEDRLGGRAEVPVPVVRVPGVLPSAAALLADVANAVLSGSESGTLAAVAAISGADSVVSPADTDAIAAQLSVPVGGGALAAAAVYSLAASGTPSSAGVAALASVLEAALVDTQAAGSRPGAAVTAALEAASALAANFGSSGQPGTTATAESVEAAERAMAVLSRAGAALMAQSVDGETTEVAAGGTSLACARSSADAAPTGVASAGAGAGISLGGISDSETTSSALPTPSDGSASTDLCVGTSAGNGYAAADANTTVGSAIVSIEARSSGGETLAVRDTPMRITLPVDAGIELNASSPVSCSFYNVTLKAFDDSGCREVGRTPTALECECDHLTDFAVRVNAPEIGNFEDIKLAGIIYVCALTGLLLVLAVPAYLLDQRRQRDYVDAQFARSDVLAGALAQSAALETSGTAARPPELVQQLAAFDATAADREHTWLQAYTSTLQTQHPAASPFFAAAASNFTIPQRVMVLFLVLVSQLFANGLVFDPAAHSASQLVVSAIIASCISVPITIIGSNLVSFWFVNGARSRYDARTTHMQQRRDERADVDPQEAANVVADDDDAELKSVAGSHDGHAAVVVADATTMAANGSSHAVDQKPVGEAVALRRVPNFGLHVTHRPQSAFPTAADVDAIAASQRANGHHLVAVTLHALSTANTLADAHHDDPAEDAVVRRVRAALGYDPEPMSDMRKKPAVRVSRGGFSRPCVLLNVVLEAYLGDADPNADPRFPMPDDASIANELYGGEMHACVWRMAIECVKERELRLAEALFTMHFILQQPDLYLVIFDAPPPSSVDEVLRCVCEATEPTEANAAAAAAAPFNVGLMWTGLYAHRLAFVDDGATYAEVHRQSAPVTSELLSVLVGLTGTDAHVASIGTGGVAYQLAAENASRAPELGSITGLTPNGKPAATAFHSLVFQAHALRLSPKPFVPELWQPRPSHRVALARATPMTELKSVLRVQHETASHRHEAVQAFAAERCAGVQAHMVPLSTVTAALASVPQLRVKAERRHRLSGFAYAAVPHAADLGATAWALERLNKQYHDQLYLRDTTHGNWYATIECGRLMALLHNARTGVHTFASFAHAYRAEVADLAEHTAANLRYDSALPSWRHASGSGKRDRSREVAGNNVVDQSAASLADPVLHRAIMRAAQSGALRVHPSVRAALTTTALRIVVPAATANFPLAQLARFHAPAVSGNGTPTTPHVGVTAAARAAGVDERIELMAGHYKPVTLRFVAGTLERPLTICPFGYHAAMQRIAAAEGREDGPVSASTAAATSNEPIEPAASDAADEPPVPVNERCLTKEERAGFSKCVIASPIAVTDAHSGADAPVISLTSCAHVRLLGLNVRRGAVGIAAEDCTDVRLVHCAVHCELPARSDGEPVVPEQVNDVTAGTSRAYQLMMAGGLPPHLTLVGYAAFALLYVFFALFTLFVTAALSDDEANRYLLETFVTTVIVMALVQPVTACAAASFSFANSVVFAALSRLITSVPL